MLSVSLGRTAARKTKDETFYGKRWFYPRTRALVLPFHVRMKINWCAVGYYSHRILSITLLAINSVGNERVKNERVNSKLETHVWLDSVEINRDAISGSDRH